MKRLQGKIAVVTGVSRPGESELRYAGHWLAKVLIYSILIYMTMIKQYIRMMQTRVGQIYLPTSFASWAFKPHI